ncbi:unnamed protein product [Aphis gossypii]|uniref:Uncharacterized protein n=1 Tax=Aphis gossypii TaxID=80765 RepID=A0A9P0IP87_APHGO|nr:unnamed protein product [Aphis gossypii]
MYYIIVIIISNDPDEWTMGTKPVAAVVVQPFALDRCAQRRSSSQQTGCPAEHRGMSTSDVPHDIIHVVVPGLTRTHVRLGGNLREIRSRSGRSLRFVYGPGRSSAGDKASLTSTYRT